MQVEAGVLVRTAAQDFGPRVALSAGQRSLTFTELNELSNRVGSALVDLGVARGDRVGVLAYNTPEVVETWFGCEKHNLVRVVLHSHFAMDSHVWSLNQVEASALIFDTRFSADVERHKDELRPSATLSASAPTAPSGRCRSRGWRPVAAPMIFAWTSTKTPRASCSSPRAPPAIPRHG